jgi:signal transduction histidine kinase
LAAYRIVQESLTNVRRHAVGAAATIMLRYDTTWLTLAVDNGPAGVGAVEACPPTAASATARTTSTTRSARRRFSSAATAA